MNCAQPSTDRLTTLVVLPGLDGTEVFLRPLLASLPDEIRRIVIDYSGATASTYDPLLHMVQEAVAGLSEFYVVAFSFGGPLAIMLAAAEPRRVRGVILAASFLRPPNPYLARLEFAAVGPVMAAIRMIRRLPVWFMRRSTDPWRIAKAELWSRVSASALAARVRALMRTDVRPLVAACQQPMLCIAFDNDRVVPRARVDEIVASAPRAEVVELPGRHFAMFASPAPLAREIARFVTRCDQSCDEIRYLHRICVRSTRLPAPP